MTNTPIELTEEEKKSGFPCYCGAKDYEDGADKCDGGSDACCAQYMLENYILPEVSVTDNRTNVGTPGHIDHGKPDKSTELLARDLKIKILFRQGIPIRSALDEDVLALAQSVIDADRIMYQSAVSGLWYTNKKAAGGLSAIRINGDIITIGNEEQAKQKQKEESIKIILSYGNKAWKDYMAGVINKIREG